MRIRLVPIRQIMSTLLRGMKGGRSPLGTPFSHIFRRATKDMAAGGTSSIERNQLVKYVKQKAMAPGGTSGMMPKRLDKHVIQKEMGPRRALDQQRSP